jgi:hypothetical protein
VLADIYECLELKHIACGIEKEHHRLLADFAFEARRRRSASVSHTSIGSTTPKCGTGTS